MAEPVYPELPGLTYGNKKTPIFATAVATGASGREQRVQRWAYPRWRFELVYEFLRDSSAYDELRPLIGFFLRAAGQGNSWLYRDPSDDTATGQLIGAGDGSTRSFQMVRTVGGWTEPVRAINVISSVKIDDTSTSAYTINKSTGVLTFNSAPPNGSQLSSTFTFYFRCRFMSDETEFSQMMRDFWENGQVQFKSVKE